MLIEYDPNENKYINLFIYLLIYFLSYEKLSFEIHSNTRAK